jgi:hypothetical protein
MTFTDQHYLCPNGGIYFMPAAEAEAIAAEGYDGPALPPPEWQPVTPQQAEAIMHPPAPEPTLEQAQAARLLLIDMAYQAAITAPIAYGAAFYQADEASVMLLNNAITMYGIAGATPNPFFWLSADNVPVPVELADLQAIGTALAARQWQAFQIRFSLKEAVRAAETIGDVEAVAWPA